MKISVFIILASVFTVIVKAQVYYRLDDDKTFYALRANTDSTFLPKTSIDLLNRVVAKQQSLERIRVPDSVVIRFQVDSTGSIWDINTLAASSKKHVAFIEKAIQHLNISSNHTVFLAFVYPPLDIESYPVFDLDEIPNLENCENVDSKNPLFMKSCFNYYVESGLDEISGPDHETTNIEGPVNAQIIINKEGRVCQIEYDNESYNGTLNDIIADQATSLIFPNQTRKNGKTVAYELHLDKSYFNLVSSSLEESLSKFRSFFDSKDFHLAIFYFSKAMIQNHAPTIKEKKMVGDAFYYSGDTSQAESWYRSIYNNKVFHEEGLVLDVSQDSLGNITIDVIEKAEDYVESNITYPVFPGCEKKSSEEERFQCFNMNIIKHINRTFKFPEMARQMGIQGRVYCSFVIEKNGQLNELRISKGVSPILDLEALRVISLLPKFEPSTREGEPVRIQYTVPINARLQ